MTKPNASQGKRVRVMSSEQDDPCDFALPAARRCSNAVWKRTQREYSFQSTSTLIFQALALLG